MMLTVNGHCRYLDTSPPIPDLRARNILSCLRRFKFSVRKCRMLWILTGGIECECNAVNATAGEHLAPGPCCGLEQGLRWSKEGCCLGFLAVWVYWRGEREHYRRIPSVVTFKYLVIGILPCSLVTSPSTLTACVLNLTLVIKSNLAEPLLVYGEQTAGHGGGAEQ